MQVSTLLLLEKIIHLFKKIQYGARFERKWKGCDIWIGISVYILEGGVQALPIGQFPQNKENWSHF